MAKSVMPKQTSGRSDSSDRFSNGEPQLLGPYRTSYRIVIGAAEHGTEIRNRGLGSLAVTILPTASQGGHRYRLRRRAIDSVPLAQRIEYTHPHFGMVPKPGSGSV
jgi:hypothetical protein